MDEESRRHSSSGGNFGEGVAYSRAMQMTCIQRLMGMTAGLAARGVVFGCGLAMSGVPVLAQAAKEAPVKLQPPTPGAPDTPPMVWNVLLSVVIIGLIVGAAMIPSKRGHQD